FGYLHGSTARGGFPRVSRSCASPRNAARTGSIRGRGGHDAGYGSPKDPPIRHDGPAHGNTLERHPAISGATMTFLEAAIEVLRTAEEPLHYADITRLA